MPTENERKLILNMIASGKITARQGLSLLDALDEQGGQPEEQTSMNQVERGQIQEGKDLVEAPMDPAMYSWRNWWQFPLWFGIGITVLSGVLMQSAYQSSGIGFWFACAGFPFLLGVAITALAWSSRSFHWLHVRLRQKSGAWPEKIAISLPLPLPAIAWFMRAFGHKIPGWDRQKVAETLSLLERITPQTPFYIDVNEGNDGERVQVFIG